MYTQAAPARPSIEWPSADPTEWQLVSRGAQWTSAPNHRLCDLGRRPRKWGRFASPVSPVSLNPQCEHQKMASSSLSTMLRSCKGARPCLSRVPNICQPSLYRRSSTAAGLLPLQGYRVLDMTRVLAGVSRPLRVKCQLRY